MPCPCAFCKGGYDAAGTTLCLRYINPAASAFVASRPFDFAQGRLFAECAKDGAPTGLVMPTRSKARATRPGLSCSKARVGPPSLDPYRQQTAASYVEWAINRHCLNRIQARRQKSVQNEALKIQARMLTIRPANLRDVPILRSLIQEMADYEKLPLLMSEQSLANDGFGSQPRFRALIAEYDNEPAGYAFFFDSYSTFQGRGLFLEDLFVRPKYRKNKVGRALISRVATIAQQENCFGIMLHVLDWNEMAIRFYRNINATFLDNWKTVCLKGSAMREVAESGADEVATPFSSL